MSDAIALFLAHSIALEMEAGERYEELAETMEVHNNPDVAALFRRMSEFSHRHAASVQQRAQPFQPLPRLKSWEYRWNAPEPPEVGDFAAAHYLMTPFHMLQFSLANERRGWEFYNNAATASPDPDVRALARVFTAEEAEHVKELEDWLARTPRPDTDWADDSDPATAGD